MREDRPWRESLAVSGALFVLSVWPVWIVTVPPLQDLPNHLATAFIQSHLERYPELVSNGFLKTNSTLFLFLHVASRVVSLRVAAKLFVTLVCAVSAFAYPRALKALGNKNVHSACFLIWPFIHNWFVAMGMLDYALSVPLVLLALVELRSRPVLAAILGVLVWYTHAFGVVMLAVLVALEIASTRKWRDMLALVLPILPALALLAISVVAQLDREASSGPSILFQRPFDLFYGAWSEYLWSLSKWTIASIASAVVLAWFGVRRFRESRSFFSPLAMSALVVLYVGTPYQWHHWYYVCSRFLPFIWFGFALRVPELSMNAKRLLGACAMTFSAGLGIEYVQNASVWNGFSRAEIAIPEHARLLPLIFDRKGPHGDNTWPMTHAWGLDVIDRGTTAPLVFAHSKSFPLTYAIEPPARYEGIALEHFPQRMRTPMTFCEDVDTGPRERSSSPAECARAFATTWRDFWTDAMPRFDRVIMFGVTPEARAEIPKRMRVVFDEGETLVLATEL